MPANWDAAVADEEIVAMAGQGQAIPGYFNKALGYAGEIAKTVTADRAVFDTHATPAQHMRRGGRRGLRFYWDTEDSVRIEVDRLVMDDDSLVGPVSVSASIRLRGAGGLDDGEPIIYTLYDVYLISSDDEDYPPSAILVQHGFSAVLPTGYTAKRFIGPVMTTGADPEVATLRQFNFNIAGGVYLWHASTDALVGQFVADDAAIEWKTVDFTGKVPFGATAAVIGYAGGVGNPETRVRPFGRGVNIYGKYNSLQDGYTGDDDEYTWFRRTVPLDDSLRFEWYWPTTQTYYVLGFYLEV